MPITDRKFTIELTFSQLCICRDVLTELDKSMGWDSDDKIYQNEGSELCMYMDRGQKAALHSAVKKFTFR